MTFKRRALGALNRAELLEVGKALELAVTSGMRLDDLLDRVAGSKKRGMMEKILPMLSRDTLKAICEAVGISSEGREKQVLIDRILAAGGIAPVTRSVPMWTALAAGWMMEKVYALLRPDAEPPMTRFLARELATAHWFDISAARRDLGYSPRVSLEEGLRRLAQSLQAQASGGLYARRPNHRRA